MSSLAGKSAKLKPPTHFACIPVLNNHRILKFYQHVSQMVTWQVNATAISSR